QKLFGARARAENYLQYKIGKALLNVRNPLKAIILPITLYNINKKHKKELELNKSLVALNPNLKAPKIEEYADYNEAVKVMNNLPYKLGGLFIKHPITFIFKARKFCKEHKSGK
ncbi:glycosyltransferase family 2 protein, partial [Campylobacter sp. Cr9]|nr:glycosyltransferase family 2 protein [Campylobacter sp. Cr9]